MHKPPKKEAHVNHNVGQRNTARGENASAPEQSQSEAEQREPRPLCGKSILAYAKDKIDDTKNLLGNRWLSRCCGAFVIAPSGHGKSTWVIQAAICWSCKKVAFGIHPASPLRILILQSEDDDNDVIEMAQMCERLNLNQREKELVNLNTHVEWLNDVSGNAFFPVLEDFLSQFPADLVILNPYSAYLGGDVRDEELNNEFLRVHLNRVMRLYNCGVLPIHHTPKTNFQNTDRYAWYDWMYTMAGCSSLTNWARGILIMSPSDVPGTYRFIAAKRFEKLGWQSREYWFAHSVENGKILWVPANADQIANGSKGKNSGPEALLTIVPMVDPDGIEKLIIGGKNKFGWGEKKVRRSLKVLLEDQKAFAHSFPRPRTNPEIRYAQTKQTNGEAS